MPAGFYRVCSCSLLDIRPHPVTKLSEWHMHLQAKEQDRLDQLFSPRGDDDEIENSSGVDDQEVEGNVDMGSRARDATRETTELQRPDLPARRPRSKPSQRVPSRRHIRDQQLDDDGASSGDNDDQFGVQRDKLDEDDGLQALIPARTPRTVRTRRPAINARPAMSEPRAISPHDSSLRSPRHTGRGYTGGVGGGLEVDHEFDAPEFPARRRRRAVARLIDHVDTELNDQKSHHRSESVAWEDMISSDEPAADQPDDDLDVDEEPPELPARKPRVTSRRYQKEHFENRHEDIPADAADSSEDENIASSPPPILPYVQHPGSEVADSPAANNENDQTSPGMAEESDIEMDNLPYDSEYIGGMRHVQGSSDIDMHMASEDAHNIINHDGSDHDQSASDGYEEVLVESGVDSDEENNDEYVVGAAAGLMRRGFVAEPQLDHEYDTYSDLLSSSDEDMPGRDGVASSTGEVRLDRANPGADSRSVESSTDDGEGGFPYGARKMAMSKTELLSVAIHDIKLTHKLSRASASDMTSLINNISFTDSVEDVDPRGRSCWDYRTTKKWIQNKTGVESISIDCCKSSCMSYALYPDKRQCDYCQHPRWKDGNIGAGKEPYATYDYIPIEHRLRLWYADPVRASWLIAYRDQVESQEGVTSDFWTGDLYRDMKAKRLFQQKTDLGFVLTTDGVQIFQSRAKFSIWPIALLCLNLPPTVRAKRQNMLCTGFIPGPKTPRDIDSFLYPLVKELEALERGIRGVLNASIPSWMPEKHFTLHGYLCLVAADMIAREKLMKVTGNRSYCYCEYCMVRGVWNGSLYCPMTPPTDTPQKARIRKGSGYPWKTWDRTSLPMRIDEEFRLVAQQIARRGATAQQKAKYGIKGLSILSRLTAVDFPRSFPPDSMHLWFENIIPDLVKHWRGKFVCDVGESEPAGPRRRGAGNQAQRDRGEFSDEPEEESADPEEDSEEELRQDSDVEEEEDVDMIDRGREEGSPGGSDADSELSENELDSVKEGGSPATARSGRQTVRARRNRVTPAGRGPGITRRARAPIEQTISRGSRPNPAQARSRGRDSTAKVIPNDDPYNIPVKIWERISTDIASSSSTFPQLFGPLLRNFLEYINMMTAAEWKLFAFIIGPVYMKGVLPEEDYVEFVNLIEAVQLTCDHSILDDDLTQLEVSIQRFSDYYERRYYRMKWTRLKACLPVFHQIIHVPQAIRWAGPMYSYSQWAMERFCGTLSRTAKSRVSTNKNISNTITMLEQKNCLVYVIDQEGITVESSDEDSDGNILLAKFLSKRIKNSRPPEAKMISDMRERDTITFCGPSKVKPLTPYERICLRNFLGNEDFDVDLAIDDAEDSQLDATADGYEIPLHCRVFRAVDFKTTVQRGDPYPFKATSSTRQRSNLTRSTSFVSFKLARALPDRNGNLRGGERETLTEYGEVLFFFTVDIPNPEENAFIRRHLQVTRRLTLRNTAATGAEPVDEQIQLKEKGAIRKKKDCELLLACVRHFPVHKDANRDTKLQR
ncbi:uncharacterized protein H6S33_011125 [Morchella sextelata]|uniref:uncharacterized protein n=1 Tax=Morchella sextelata TaxID=1174677 RepID=UPI001D04840B|nr:uncharacterized protein H6S33_011125 [Morchella sextelata]KAH0611860.1 hypothetical protein H6S33_011125 [Morchella sextelata]